MVKWRYMRTLSSLEWICSDGEPIVYIYRSKKYFTSHTPFDGRERTLDERERTIDDHFLNWPEVTEAELQMFELSQGFSIEGAAEKFKEVFKY